MIVFWRFFWEDPLGFIARMYPFQEADVFAGTIVEGLTGYWNAQLLPGEWHRPLNMVVLLLEIPVVAWCIAERRIFDRDLVTQIGPPSRLQISSTPKSSISTIGKLGLSATYTMLMIHSIFYLYELTFTAMMSRFSPMALHHILSLAIFFAIALEPRVISLISIAPFLAHAAIWLVEINNRYLLALYNVSFLLSGLSFLARRGWLNGMGQHVKLSSTVEILTMTIVATNYFTYCWSYLGSMCPPRRLVWVYDLIKPPSDLEKLERRLELPFLKNDRVTGWEWMCWSAVGFGSAAMLCWWVGCELGRRRRMIDHRPKDKLS
ncbi:hypothetical protein BJ742DRAFT_786317 [Cladochytrium replicatum]|nr:hypothetical protein BJ742DRAFT_786317 [Cladochytrium replicatum]